MEDAEDFRDRGIRCQPIASLAARKREYWMEVQAVVPTLGFVAVVGAALCIGAIKLLDVPWWKAAFACAFIMGPPVWRFWPDYPSQDDVDRDRALRRAAGLPDEVEPD
ncbi:hypothetical protein [Ralstonia insidiosa]|jgi:hypothetical protein|nr:hypothetical protein [Ralstonia insidiosa]MBX3905056.1 hypothetical protein [Ralstonia insidiosa]